MQVFPEVCTVPNPRLIGLKDYGAICTTRTHEEWVCDAAKQYTFLGETQQLTQVEISERGKICLAIQSRPLCNSQLTPGNLTAGAITEGDNCYNIATNNCKTWANKLWKDIKARDIFSWHIAEPEIEARAMEELDMLGERDEWQIGERTMEQLYEYEQDLYKRDMFEQDVY